MIWHTHLWKLELHRTASELRRKTLQERYPETTLANIEKRTFLAFYIVRKLLDAHQVSDRLRLSTIDITSFPAKGKPVTYLNLHKVDELYDFTAVKRERLALRKLCNLIIHSYVFVPAFGARGKLEAVLVSSENTRNDKIYRLRIKEIVNLLDEISSEELTEIHAVWDSMKHDYTISLA